MLRRFLPYGARAAAVRAGCPVRSARSRCRHRTVVRDDRSGVPEGAAHTIRPHTRNADDCPGTPEAARQTCALRDCRFRRRRAVKVVRRGGVGSGSPPSTRQRQASSFRRHLQVPDFRRRLHQCRPGRGRDPPAIDQRSRQMWIKRARELKVGERDLNAAVERMKHDLPATVGQQLAWMRELLADGCGQVMFHPLNRSIEVTLADLQLACALDPHLARALIDSRGVSPPTWSALMKTPPEVRYLKMSAKR